MSDFNQDRFAVADPYGTRGPQAPSVSTFGEAVRAFFSKYATFSGRSNRPEYWYAVLFLVIVSIVTQMIDIALFGTRGFNLVTSVFQLATLIPSLSVTVRRLHDIDRTGWWLLLALVPILGWIVLIVFNCQKGTEGANRFG